MSDKVIQLFLMARRLPRARGGKSLAALCRCVPHGVCAIYGGRNARGYDAMRKQDSGEPRKRSL
jgi:hypothetical protein